jgi:sugar-specific transcriptional regulator TrmB
VEVQSGRPSRYRSRAPAEVIRLVKTEQERKLKEIGEAVVKELEPLYSQKAEAKRPDVWVIRGTKNLVTRIGEMLARASVEALISIPNVSQEVSGLISYMPLLEAKNIAVRVLVSGRLKLRKSDLPRRMDIRKRETLFGGGVVVDGREVLLVLGSGGELLGIWSDEVGLARFAKEYFEYLWKDSELI